jgi:hypothetical protein
MGGFDDTRDAVNLIASAIDTSRFIEHAIFGEEFIDRLTPARWINFAEDIAKIAYQQS